MCTRLVYSGKNMITGFNFDIDLAVWKHRVLMDSERFYIGIMRPDGNYHSYHGVNRNGNVGTLLYVHGNTAANFRDDAMCMTVADLTEQYIRGEITFDQATELVRTRKIVYAPNATMQAMLSDRLGRTLLIEPGIGFRQCQERFSVVTNYSLLNPESTKRYIVPGDDRYERAVQMLQAYQEGDFSVQDAFSVLYRVRQEGIWATRVTFVYSAAENAVYYLENNQFDAIQKYTFPE